MPLDKTVALGMPCFDHHKFRMLEALDKMVMYSQDRDIKISAPIRRRGAWLPSLRAEIVDIAVNAYKSDYLLFIDADMSFAPNSLVRLLGHDLDIVSGLYFSRFPPFQPIAANYIEDEWRSLLEWPEAELVEVDGVGAGFLLIKTDVLREIPQPHWLGSWTEERGYVSEDNYFCVQAKKAGFKVWLDTSLELTHIGEYPFGRSQFEEVKASQEQRQIITPREAVDGVTRIH